VCDEAPFGRSEVRDSRFFSRFFSSVLIAPLFPPQLLLCFLFFCNLVCTPPTIIPLSFLCPRNAFYPHRCCLSFLTAETAGIWFLFVSAAVYSRISLTKRREYSRQRSYNKLAALFPLNSLHKLFFLPGDTSPFSLPSAAFALPGFSRRIRYFL